MYTVVDGQMFLPQMAENKRIDPVNDNPQIVEPKLVYTKLPFLLS